MALVKASFISELSLLPLKRFLQGQRTAENQNYQLATEEYCTQLRNLYRLSLRERRQAFAALKRAHKEANALSNEVFKLTLSENDELQGISIARASSPLAELNDRVQLMKLTAKSDEPIPLVDGVVTLVTEQQVRIKFQEPLKGQKKREQQQQQTSNVDSKSSGLPPKDPSGDKPDDASELVDTPKPGESKRPAAEQNGEQHKEPKEAEEAKKPTEQQQQQPPEVICVRIKFVPNTHNSNSNVKTPIRGHGHDQDQYAHVIEDVLHNFAKLKCNQALHKILMGSYDGRYDLASNDNRSRVVSPFGGNFRPRPNKQQHAAIEQALRRRITLIEGPAGSGKTLVAALIAANACRLRQSRVLVCSPIQATVDKLTELLLHLVGGLQVIKLPENVTPPRSYNPRLAANRKVGSSSVQNGQHKSKTRGAIKKRGSYISQAMGRDEGGDDDHDHHHHDDDDDDDQQYLEANRCHLDKIVDDEIYLQAYARSKDTLGHNHEQLHAHAYRMVTSCSLMRRREMEAKMISKANVISCTLVQASSYLLKNVEFDMLILDDQHLTSELDCLVGIMATKGVKQLTLLSDTRRSIRLARSRVSRSESQPARVGTYSSGTHSTQATITTKQGLMRAGSSASNNINSLGSSSAPLQRGKGATRIRHLSQSSTSSRESSDDPVLTSKGKHNNKSKCPPDVSLEPGNLFERLLSLGLPTVDMRIQYRCHATLSNFFIHHFYAGRLRGDRRSDAKMSAEINSSLLLSERNFSWLPNRKYLTAMFQVLTDHSLDKLEEQVAIILNSLLVNENIQESRIGIIYNRHSLLGRAQKRETTSGPSRDVKRGTIDRFIGQERDFIILVAGSSSPTSSWSDSHVRDGNPNNFHHNNNNNSSDIKTYLGLTSEIHCDFRSHDAALNWALTRAKLGLFIVADTSKTTATSAGEGSSTSNNNNNNNKATSSSDNQQAQNNGSDEVVDRALPLIRQATACDDSGSWSELVKYYHDNELLVSCPAS